MTANSCEAIVRLRPSNVLAEPFTSGESWQYGKRGWKRCQKLLQRGKAYLLTRHPKQSISAAQNHPIWRGGNVMSKARIHTLVAGAALFCTASGVALAAAPTAATIISKEDVDKVLKLGIKATDHTIRVVDMGQGYQMSVAVVHRGRFPAPPRPPSAAAAAAAPPQPACGLATAPAGAKTGPKGMLAHTSTAETYIVISGAGTLVTGGQILQGRMSPPDSEVTTTLNGPTCGGTAVGDFVMTPVKVGDIAVIPAGVPHGWSDIPTEVTYLSVRPDPKHVLPKAPFTYPGLK
jgi:mannose-6-phosphate isomerase-like protein (cupin superfamily)